MDDQKADIMGAMQPELHIETLQALTDPSGAFREVAGMGCAFLDGRGGAPSLARYSFLCAEPLATLETRGVSLLFVEGKPRMTAESPFEAIRSLLKTYQVPPQPTPFPFVGGAIGYLGYDLGQHIERLPRRAVDDLGLPDLWLGVYDCCLVYDATEAVVRLVRWSGLPGQDADRAAQRVERLRRAAGSTAQPPTSAFQASVQMRSSFAQETYLAAVRRAKEHIAAGDIYQVNLSQRLSLRTRVPSPELFLLASEASPAPFSAYLDPGPFQVLSTSPERFLRVDGRRVETRPIKGTRPRGQNAEEDARLAAELLASEKDAAELAMIVDLERNDLGRVCEYGTVRVARARELESFPNVHHLVATVEGTMRERCDVVDLLVATFPGGSITGCPKIRAMEIIDELEPVRRGVYTGAIGYFGMDGRMDLSIAIRNAVVMDGIAHVSVGGAIVADSDPEAEYRETWAKARGWLDVLGVQE